MKLKYISLFFVLFSFVIGQNEFSEGPYGNNYFDTAGPFTLPDLNASLDGDINIDNVVNIQDIIFLINIIPEIIRKRIFKFIIRLPAIKEIGIKDNSILVKFSRFGNFFSWNIFY